MEVHEITLKIYANSEEEVNTMKMVVTEFIRMHAQQGRAVTAAKVSKALANWDKNPFVKNRIISYLNG